MDPSVHLFIHSFVRSFVRSFNSFIRLFVRFHSFNSFIQFHSISFHFISFTFQSVIYLIGVFGVFSCVCSALWRP